MTSCYPKPEAEKHGVWSWATLLTENTRNVGEILLIICYHKEPIANGLITKGCKF